MRPVTYYGRSQREYKKLIFLNFQAAISRERHSKMERKGGARRKGKLPAKIVDKLNV